MRTVGRAQRGRLSWSGPGRSVAPQGPGSPGPPLTLAEADLSSIQVRARALHL